MTPNRRNKVVSIVLPRVQVYLFAASLLFGLVLSLWSSAHGAPGSEYTLERPKALVNAETEYKNQAQQLYGSIQEMAFQLFQNLYDPDPDVGELADGVAVTSFVDLKKLTRTSSFGRYLAEQLTSEFQHQGFSVIEIRKSTSIAVQEKRGEYGLSRNPDSIPPEIQARAMVTGTYTIAGDHIMVNAKVIDSKTSQLLSSATTLFPKNNLADLLLADSASASIKKQAVTYMKRLEL